MASHAPAVVVSQDHVPQAVGRAGQKGKAHFVGAEDTQMLEQRLGARHFVAWTEKMNKRQDLLRKNPQCLGEAACSKQAHYFLVSSRKHGRSDDHASVRSEQKAAESDDVIANEDGGVAVFLESGDFAQVVVGHLHAHRVRAGIQDGEQLLGPQPGLRVERVVVNHQLQVRAPVERFEKLQNHGERVREIIWARHQSGRDAEVFSAPRQPHHFFEIRVRKPDHDLLSGRRVSCSELHHLEPLLKGHGDAFPCAPANGVPIEVRKEVLEKLREAVEINLTVVERRGNDR